MEYQEMPLALDSSEITALTQNADDSVLICIQIHKIGLYSRESTFVMFKGELGKLDLIGRFIGLAKKCVWVFSIKYETHFSFSPITLLFWIF